MDLCSHDEAAKRVAASALTLALVDVEPDDVADLLVGIGSLEGLGAPRTSDRVGTLEDAGVGRRPGLWG